METPLYTAIEKYIKKSPSRFHMPAHFGCGDFSDLYKSAKFDITELDFSDNLVNPNGVIDRAQQLAAGYYNCQKAMYFTSGATVALLTAIATATECGDTIIMERSCHRSAYAAVKLFGLKPYYVYPDFENGVARPMTAEKLNAAIKNCGEAVAVVLTSPNYFGLTASLELADVVKASGKRLIVDEAHGAHFPFSKLLPDGFADKADLVVESLHKTLPVYTGGALLAINDSSLFDRAKQISMRLNTSSPSYLVMASMDYALGVLGESGEAVYSRLYQKIESFKAELTKFEFLPSNDFTRLSIKCGAEVVAKLIKNGFYPEMVYGDWAVFIVSPYNMDRLEGLKCLLLKEKPSLGKQTDFGFEIKPIQGAVGGKTVFLPLEEAVGKTSADELGFYPPGIPLVASGEVITQEIAHIFKINANLDKFGFISDKVCVTI